MQEWHDEDLLAQALGERVTEFDVSPLTQGESGVLVARVTGRRADGEQFSVIVKSRQGEPVHAALWYARDAGITDREYHVYDLLERLDLPRACALAREYVDAGHWTLILEDLAQNYRLPGPDYTFTEADWPSIINTYAKIHARTRGMSGPILERLQPEEGSQADTRSMREMLDALSGFEVDSQRLRPEEFWEASAILLELREKWRDERRCMVFSDFYPANLALPKPGSEYAVLFDWELAAFGLPQFDILNAGFTDDEKLDRYFLCMRALGAGIDPDKLKAGLGYARLCASFYTLWLLHLKLKADPQGPLPSWMRSGAADLFSGGLIRLARDARQ